MRYAICALIGYIVGTLNPSYFLAKHHGIDIRTRGSKNAGASNALLVFGKLRGTLCALFDVGKAVGVVCLTRALYPGDSGVFAVAASACILGHIFPFYMGFRGGKGLACLAGVILAYDLRGFGVLLAVEVVVLFTTCYICFVPMTASLVFPIIYGVMNGNLPGSLLLAGVAVVIQFRHGENIRRALRGQELRISYLWNREAESARMRANYPEQEWDHPEM